MRQNPCSIEWALLFFKGIECILYWRILSNTSWHIAYFFLNNAMDSTWLVCGNISIMPAATSSY